MTARMLSLSAGALTALALVPASAGAVAGNRSFTQTYPYASALCAKAQAGTLPKKLAPQRAQVTTACTTLQSSFTQDQSTVQAAQTSFQSGVAAARAARKAACAPPRQQPKCRDARITAQSQLRTLRVNHRAAVRTYSISVEAARRTFWSTIRSLRGGSSVPADQPIAPQGS